MKFHRIISLKDYMVYIIYLQDIYNTDKYTCYEHDKFVVPNVGHVGFFQFFVEYRSIYKMKFHRKISLKDYMVYIHTPCIDKASEHHSK